MNFNAQFMLGKAESGARLWSGALGSILTAGHNVSPREQPTLEVENAVMTLQRQPGDHGTYMDPATDVHTPRKYLYRELAWYLSGDQKPTMVSQGAPMWRGLTDKNGRVNSNYGYHTFYKRHRLGMTQWQWVVETLTADPWSRQAVIQIYDQQHQNPRNKDVPCTCAVQFRVRGGFVNTTVFMRSNDIRRGLTFDMPFFMFLQEQLARILQDRWQMPVEPGLYVHIAGSLHLYAPDFQWYMEQYDGDIGNLDPSRFQHGVSLPINEIVTPPYADPTETIRQLLEATK